MHVCICASTKMFTHVCICTCTSETLQLLWCVYLACTLLELFKGSFFQVQLQTGVKLERWDFLADLKDFIEAFTVYMSRMTFQDMSNLTVKLGKCAMSDINLSGFKKHLMEGKLLSSSKIFTISSGYLQSVKISISIAQWISQHTK